MYQQRQPTPERTACAAAAHAADAANAPASVGTAVIRTASIPIRGNLQIELDSVVVRNLDVNRDFDVIYFGPSTFADRVKITNSVFQSISGAIVSATSDWSWW